MTITSENNYRALDKWLEGKNKVFWSVTAQSSFWNGLIENLKRLRFQWFASPIFSQTRCMSLW